MSGEDVRGGSFRVGGRVSRSGGANNFGRVFCFRRGRFAERLLIRGRKLFGSL